MIDSDELYSIAEGFENATTAEMREAWEDLGDDAPGMTLEAIMARDYQWAWKRAIFWRDQAELLADDEREERIHEQQLRADWRASRGVTR